MKMSAEIISRIRAGKSIGLLAQISVEFPTSNDFYTKCINLNAAAGLGSLGNLGIYICDQVQSRWQ